MELDPRIHLLGNGSWLLRKKQWTRGSSPRVTAAKWPMPQAAGLGRVTRGQCADGDVGLWHIATFRCDSPPWSLLEGMADMNGRVASAKNVEIDPERKLNAPRSGMITPASPR